MYINMHLAFKGLLRKKLSLYLDTFCHNTTSLPSALQKDIKNDHLFLQLQALGLIGKLVTGPWMKICMAINSCPILTALHMFSYV